VKIERHFSLREIAGILGISIDAARTLREKRLVATRKIGGRIRISESDLEAFLQRTRTAAFGEAIGNGKKAE
jgi:hypothetical protein